MGVVWGLFGAFFVLWIMSEGDSEAFFISFAEPVSLERVFRDGRIDRVFEINEAKIELPPAPRFLFNQADVLESGKWTEDIYIWEREERIRRGWLWGNKGLTGNLSFNRINRDSVDIKRFGSIVGDIECRRGNRGLGLVAGDGIVVAEAGEHFGHHGDHLAQKIDWIGAHSSRRRSDVITC